MNLHLPRAVGELPGTGACGREPDDDNRVSMVGEHPAEVVHHSTTGGHTGGGDDDRRHPRVVPLRGGRSITHLDKPVRVERLVENRIGPHLRPGVGQSFAVDAETGQRHRTVQDDGQVGNHAVASQPRQFGQDHLGAVDRERRDEHAAAALRGARDRFSELLPRTFGLVVPVAVGGLEQQNVRGRTRFGW